jgi:hypothetical protein
MSAARWSKRAITAWLVFHLKLSHLDSEVVMVSRRSLIHLFQQQPYGVCFLNDKPVSSLYGNRMYLKGTMEGHGDVYLGRSSVSTG